MTVYSHSFNPTIYGDSEYGSHLLTDTDKRELRRLRRGTKLPTDLVEALVAIGERKWNRMCREVFKCSPDYVDLDTVVSKVVETDKWSPAGDEDNPAVSFWIDEDGYWTVDVYDKDGTEDKEEKW